jgi:outer membrane protein assembly factor BamB
MKRLTMVLICIILAAAGCGGNADSSGVIIWQGSGMNNWHTRQTQGTLLAPFAAEWDVDFGGIGNGAFAIADVPDIPLKNDKLVFRLAFMASNDGNVYAFDWQTGEIVWHQKLISAAGDILFAKGRVYVSSADGIWNCFSAWDGKPEWTSRFYAATATIDPIWKGRAENAAPVADDLNLYAGHSTKNLMALDLIEGKEKWNILLGDAIMSSPVLVDDKIVVADYSKKLTLLHATTGKKVWEVDLDDKVSTNLLCDGKYVYTTGAFGNVAAFDLKDGKKVWTLDIGGTIPYSSCFAGKFLIVADGLHSKVHFVTLDTGMIKDTVELKKLEIGSSLVACDNYICFGTKDGKVICIDSAKKTVMNAYQFKSSRYLQANRTYGCPAVAFGRLLITDGLSNITLLAPKDVVEQQNKTPIKDDLNQKKDESGSDKEKVEKEKQP